jgi:hypothetical protein
MTEDRENVVGWLADMGARITAVRQRGSERGGWRTTPRGGDPLQPRGEGSEPLLTCSAREAPREVSLNGVPLAAVKAIEQHVHQQRVVEMRRAGHLSVLRSSSRAACS